MPIILVYVYIAPHTGDLFIEFCRCGYVVALVLHIPPHRQLDRQLAHESCRYVYVVALVATVISEILNNEHSER